MVFIYLLEAAAVMLLGALESSPYLLYFGMIQMIAALFVASEKPLVHLFPIGWNGLGCGAMLLLVRKFPVHEFYYGSVALLAGLMALLMLLQLPKNANKQDGTAPRQHTLN